MIILSFDGTAKIASVAVSLDEKNLALYNIDNGLTQSELLLPMAENALKCLKMSFSDVNLLATSVGPGSFTGVRIGTALIKGIAFGKNIPCVAVSTLEALSENLAGIQGIVVPCMDARRNQVYNAIFRSDGSKVTRLTEDRAISITDLAEELKAFSGEDIYIVGDGYKVAYDGLTKCAVDLKDTPPLLVLENAASVARVAYRMYKNGEYTDDISLLPTYLRLPQAERERLEKENEKSHTKNKNGEN
jgi:tRNA threonylcarbamoyladenosine biosynthesis protein TsaB